VQTVEMQEYTATQDEQDVETLERLLNKHYPRTPFRVGVGISVDGLRYAGVGIKLFGDSPHRKGRWTRCTIAASVPVEQGLPALAAEMRKLYAEYANQPHPGLNTFKRRRTRTPVLGGHRRNK
jgi:hypothetical protein